jgi:hypothetical protein
MVAVRDCSPDVEPQQIAQPNLASVSSQPKHHFDLAQALVRHFTQTVR